MHKHFLTGSRMQDSGAVAEPGNPSRSGALDRKSLLALISLALYWAAILSMASSFALAVASNDFLAPAAGSIGLVGGLLLFGAVPKIITSKRISLALRILAIATPFLYLACIVSSDMGFHIPCALFLALRFVLGFCLSGILCYNGVLLSRCENIRASLISALAFLCGVVIFLAGASVGLSMNPILQFALTLGAGLGLVFTDFHEETAGEAFIQSATTRRQTLPKGFWPLWIGLLLYSLVYGLAVSMTLALGRGQAQEGPASLALLVPGVIFLLLLARYREEFDFRRFQWVLFAPSVAVLLPLPFLDATWAMGCCAILILIFSFYDLASFILLVELCKKNKDRDGYEGIRMGSPGKLSGNGYRVAGLQCVSRIRFTPLSGGLDIVQLPRGIRPGNANDVFRWTHVRYSTRRRSAH